MIRQILAELFPKREARIAETCSDFAHPDHPEGVHYHYGYGQRHWDYTPHNGPNDFSSGKPFIKRRGEAS